MDDDSLAFVLGATSVVAYAFAIAALGRRGALARSAGRQALIVVPLAILIYVAACATVFVAGTLPRETNFASTGSVYAALIYGVVGLATYSFGATRVSRSAFLELGPVWFTWVALQVAVTVVGAYAMGVLVSLVTGAGTIA